MEPAGAAEATPTSATKVVNKLLPKRLRRKRTPSISNIQWHPTFSSGDLTASADQGAAGIDGEDGEAYDSDPEISSSSDASRPKPVPTARPSQIGYLTTSSSVVQAAHLPEFKPDPSSSSAALATSSSRPSSRRSSKSDIFQDSERRPRSRNRAQLAVDHQPTRSASPAGRIRDIFSKKSSSGSKIGSDPDTGSPVRQLKPVATFAAQSRKSSPQGARRPHTSHADRPTTPPPAVATAESLPPSLIVSTLPTPTLREFEVKTPQKHELAEITISPPKPTAHGTPSKGGVSVVKRPRTGSASLVPSKLSTATLPPATPDEARPTASGGSPAASGFFSSMLSVAQNAASTFSNTLISPNNSNSRSRATTPQGLGIREGDLFGAVSTQPAMEPKDSAVRTLGSGDLSLSQLGLSEPAVIDDNTPIATKFSDIADLKPRPDVGDLLMVSTIDPGSDDIANSRPRSGHDTGNELSSPSGSLYEEKPSGLGRSGSVRSALGRISRNRGGSNTTGPASLASTSNLNLNLNATANGPNTVGGPKLTGFAIASKKRNRDFHHLFKSVPDDDYLIEDYSCALQREILAHGRLYVSEGHLCFSSNILGWVTTLVMSFGEIVSVEKRSTALLFKNGLMITTLHAKHIFASFTSRDATYDLIVNIWKLGHPSLMSSLNGVRLEGTGGDKTEKVDAPPALPELEEENGSNSEEESEEEDVYDEDDDVEQLPEYSHITDASLVEAEPDKAASRKVSGNVGSGGGQGDQPKEPFPATAGSANDFPGPTTHGSTDCGDAASHYDKVVGDEIISAPVGQVYNLIFGPESVSYMSKWLQGEQKCFDLQMDDKKGLTPANKTRTFNYIKPLNGSIGPRQTKCIVTETLDLLDLEKAVNISVVTATPDVPSGNVFTVKTKYCLSWAENNSTRMQANCTIEWTGKSWIKGPIESGANSGQTQYVKDLVAAIKAAVSRPRSSTGGAGATKGAKSRKRGSGRNKATQSPAGSVDVQTAAAQRIAAKDWGLLQPVRPILQPIFDLGKPIFSGNILYGFLIGLFMAWWFGFGLLSGPSSVESSRPHGGDRFGFSLPDKIAAYEEMWRREESDLWEWLEERVGLDKLADGLDGAASGSRFGPTSSVRRMKAGEARIMQDKLREENIEARELEDAIRVTEERLRVLKEVMKKKRVE